MSIFRKSGIYKIENKVNGKVYVGSSVNINKRFSNHSWKLRGNKHINPHLQNAWNKYGEESFSFDIIEEIDSSLFLEREQFHIDRCKSNDSKYGYNNAPVAGSNLGYRFTPEQKKRLSVARKGYKPSEEAIINMSKAQSGPNHRMYGRKQPQKVRDKIAKTLLNHEVSEETRNKIREASRGNKNHCKLTLQDVKEIKKLLEEGEMTQWEIANKFNVIQTTISHIKVGRNWSLMN